MGLIIVLLVEFGIPIIIGGIISLFLTKRSNSHQTNTPSGIDHNAYNMSWPKPSPYNLWDTLDYFVRLAEVQSSLSTDTTVVSLDICTKDYNNKQRGQFTLRYFDFDQAKGVYGNRIPYLLDVLKNYDGSDYEVYDPTSTILNFTPNRVFEIVKEEAPHATLGNVYNAEKEGVIMISFVFPSRWSS